MGKPALPTLSVPKAALNMNLIAFAAHSGEVKTDFSGKNAPIESAYSIIVLYHLEFEDNTQVLIGLSMI
ncbi:hypothetical protein MFLAVUS_000073 [Mucor flavus]|uniref:Uncharacterized protein n=1 Tax=Mucor flavus TaxID=439312 RepID=A0ABP9YIP9_9FUNG